MDSNRQRKILLNQFSIAKKEIEKNGIENVNLIPHIDDKNIYVWYFLIKGLCDAYADGEYIFKLTAPKTFPQKPPSFEFLTPNGVYDLGGPICISVGEFHSNDHNRSTSSGDYGWRPALGMMGFATQVLNGLITFDDNDHGIRIINSSYEQKQDYAKKSIEYNNTHYSEIYKNFDFKKIELKGIDLKENILLNKFKATLGVDDIEIDEVAPDTIQIDKLDITDNIAIDEVVVAPDTNTIQIDKLDESYHDMIANYNLENLNESDDDDDKIVNFLTGNYKI